MGRRRLIDTEGLYFDTELVNALGDKGLHLYIMLWGLAEDWGGYEPKYDDIALKSGALKIKQEEVKKYINLLIEQKKIFTYTANGKEYHWLANLLKHQPLNNPSLPKLPLPEWITYEVRQYKEGRKYACYAVDSSKLPVGYSLIEMNSNVMNSNVRKQPPTTLTDEQFIQSLKDNPAYSHINIDNELAKMDAYLSVNPGKQKTRRYIINWMNRKDKPVVNTRLQAQYKIEKPEPVSPEEQAKIQALIKDTLNKLDKRK